MLGEKKISYLGFSYGTYLGAVYAQMFPRRADRFVLDSANDPARVWRGMFQGQAQAAGPAFTRWSEWTARRDAAYHLGGTPEEVRAAFRDLVARADRTPVVSEGRTLTGDGIRSELRPAFSRVQKAAERVSALKKAADGEKTEPGTPAKTPAPAPSGFAHDVPSDNEDSRRLGRPVRRQPYVAARPGAVPSRRGPRQGPVPAVRRFRVEHQAVRLLGAGRRARDDGGQRGRRADPAERVGPPDPLADGRAMHRALRGSRIVTVADGEGHIVQGSNSCADKSLGDYLTTGRLPVDDLTCPAPDRT